MKRIITLSLGLCFTLTCLVGCDLDSLTDGPTEGQPAVPAPVAPGGTPAAAPPPTPASNIPGADGSHFKFDADGGIETTEAYVRLIQVGTLQTLHFTSYQNASAIGPGTSVMIIARIQITDWSALTNSVVDARVYAKNSKDTYYTADGKTAQLQISAVVGNTVTARIVSGELTKLSDGSVVPYTGSLEAAWLKDPAPLVLNPIKLEEVKDIVRADIPFQFTEKHLNLINLLAQSSASPVISSAWTAFGVAMDSYLQNGKEKVNFQKEVEAFFKDDIPKEITSVSLKQPYAPMMVRNESKDLYLFAKRLLTHSQNSFEKIKPLEKNSEELANVHPIHFGKLNATARVIGRIGAIFTAIGEPAGSELTSRAKAWKHIANVTSRRVAGRPGAGPAIKAFRPNVERTAKANLANITMATKLRGDGDIIGAYLLVLQSIAEIDMYAVWYPEATTNTVYKPYLDFLASIKPDLLKLLVDTGLKDLASQPSSKSLTGPELLVSIDQAVSNFSKTGMATPIDVGLTGEQAAASLDGPAFIEHLIAIWKKQFYSMARAHVIDAAKVAMGKPTGADSVTYAECSGLQAKIASSILAILDADAKRIDAMKARETSLRYIQVLTPYILDYQRTDDVEYISGTFLPAADASLKAIYSKDPTYSKEIAEYTRYTNDILRWREEITTAETAKDSTRYEEPQTVIVRFFPNNDPLEIYYAYKLKEAFLQDNITGGLNGKSVLVKNAIPVHATTNLIHLATPSMSWDATVEVPIALREHLARVAVHEFILGPNLTAPTLATNLISYRFVLAVPESISGFVKEAYLDSYLPYMLNQKPESPVFQNAPVKEQFFETNGDDSIMIRIWVQPILYKSKYFFVKVLDEGFN